MSPKIRLISRLSDAVSRSLRGLAIIGSLLFIAAVVLFCYLMFFIDSTKEIKRGTLLGELLLTSKPIRAFPDDTVVGARRYYYTTGEPTGKSVNILRIEVVKIEPSMIDRCEEWLKKCGFKLIASDTARTQLKMIADDGRTARISAENVFITISVEH